MPDAPQPTEPTAAPATGTPDPIDPPAAPEPTDPAAEVEKWKTLARDHEAKWRAAEKINPESAKTAADLRDLRRKATEYDKYVESQKTESQKLADKATAAEQRAADTAVELARMKAAVKHGLSEDDLAFLTGPAEEIDGLAERLAARLKGIVPPVVPVTPPAPSAAGQGNVGDPIGGPADPIKALDAQIADATKSGNFQLVIALKEQRHALASAKN